MKLTLDGKEIGTIEGDKLVSADGVKPTDDAKQTKDTMDVPANVMDPRIRRAIRSAVVGDDDDTPLTDDDKPDDDKPDDDKPDDVVDEAKLNELLSTRENRALMSQLQTLLAEKTKTATPAKLEVQDLIPELTKEDDPLGVARTLKSFIQNFGKLEERVQRIDEYFSWTEYQRAVEGEKAKYDIFTDKKLATVANRMLDLELKSNANDSMASVVEQVAKDIEKLGKKATPKKKVEKKVDQSGKIPQTLRTADGVTPAVTVTKPKTVQEASEAYEAWRAASRRQNRG
jgi:hypothetical protein